MEFAFISIRSPLTKKQCPGRLKLFFDYLGLGGGDSVEEQGRVFLAKAKTEEAYWAEDNILLFLDFDKQRVLIKKNLLQAFLTTITKPFDKENATS